MVKNPPANAGDTGDMGSIPGSGRSPGGGNGNPLQYSCLENPRTEEPGGLQSMGSKKSDTNEVIEQACRHMVLCIGGGVKGSYMGTLRAPR